MCADSASPCLYPINATLYCQGMNDGHDVSVSCSVDSGAGSVDWSQVGSGQGTCDHRLGELMGTHRIRELVQHRSQQPVGFHQVRHPEGT